MSRVDGENWLRLHLAARDTVRVRTLVKKYRSATELLEKEPQKMFDEGEIDGAILGKLVYARSYEMRRRIEETVSLCKKNGWRIITPQSRLYPERLLKLRRFPFVLYADGDAELLNAPLKCSVVGTRGASQKARAVAYKLSYGLSQLGTVIVSGGALGVDSASHEGALAGKTGTIGVLGAGLGSEYLRQNDDLRRRIAAFGVLISELEPFESPSRYTFPERNRIIASLGDGCFVAESGVNGGSLITASRARECGRPIFVPSPSILSSDGCAALAAEGATEISSPAELYSAIAGKDAPVSAEAGVPMSLSPDYDVDFALPGFKTFFFGENADGGSVRTTKTTGKKTKKTSSNGEKTASKTKKDTSLHAENKNTGFGEPSAPEKRLFTESPEPTLFTVAPMTDGENGVLKVLTKTPMSLDKIVETTGLGTDIVSSSLTLLELRGTVSSYYGNLYSLKNDPAEAE